MNRDMRTMRDSFIVHFSFVRFGEKVPGTGIWERDKE
jgi:hypothetical protein